MCWSLERQTGWCQWNVHEARAGAERDRQDGVNGMSMKHVQSLEETDRMVSMEQV